MFSNKEIEKLLDKITLEVNIQEQRLEEKDFNTENDYMYSLWDNSLNNIISNNLSIKDEQINYLLAYKEKKNKEFKNENINTWCEEFKLHSLYGRLCFDIVEYYYDNIIINLSEQEKEDNKSLVVTLLYLFRKAIRTYNTIRIILSEGYGDKAYAFWRSLYELEVLSKLFIKEGNYLAYEFIEFEKIQNNKGVKSYDWCKVVKRFKKENNITFNKIQDYIGYNDNSSQKREYKNACDMLHASYNSVFKTMGLPDNFTTTKFIEKSTIGLDVALGNSVHCLYNIVYTFTRISPDDNIDKLVSLLGCYMIRIKEKVEEKGIEVRNSSSIKI